MWNVSTLSSQGLLRLHHRRNEINKESDTHDLRLNDYKYILTCRIEFNYLLQLLFKVNYATNIISSNFITPFEIEKKDFGLSEDNFSTCYTSAGIGNCKRV